jgi:hypothetical protein
MDWEWFKAAAGRGACMWPCQGRGRRSPAEGLNRRREAGGLCRESADLKIRVRRFSPVSVGPELLPRRTYPFF